MTSPNTPSVTEAELALLAEALLDGVLYCGIVQAGGVSDLDGLERQAVAKGLHAAGLLVPYDLGEPLSASGGSRTGWMLTADGVIWTNLILNDRALSAGSVVRRPSGDIVD